MEPGEEERPAARRRPRVDPWARFAGVFAVLGIGSEFLYFLVIRGSDALLIYLEVIARISGFLIALLGREIEVIGTSVWDGEFMVDIAPECDAIQLCTLLLSAMLAFPTSTRRKLTGMLQGLVLIQVCNFVRIVSLYFIGSYDEGEIFHDAHEVWWPIVLIVYTVGVWVFWARRVQRVEHEPNGENAGDPTDLS